MSRNTKPLQLARSLAHNAICLCPSNSCKLSMHLRKFN